MQVKLMHKGNNIRAVVKGRIDTNTAQDFHDAFKDLDFEGNSLVLDFENVDFISSAGLRELMMLRKRIKEENRFMLNHISDAIEEILSVTGFIDFIPYTKKQEKGDTYLQYSFGRLLKEKAASMPDLKLMKYCGIDYTWSDIDRASIMIAEDLAKMGVKKGTHVGIFGGNSPSWIFTFFAAQRLGAITFLVNFAFTAEEAADVCTLGDVTHLLIGITPRITNLEAFQENIIADRNNTVEKTYVFRGFEKVINSSNSNSPALVASAIDVDMDTDDVALSIYTSGSTGKPKSVLLSSYNVINAANIAIDEIFDGIYPDDTQCFMMPLNHIFGLLLMVITFLSDSKMVIAQDVKTDTLLDIIAEDRCTCFSTVPTMMLALVNNKRYTKEMTSTLRKSVLAGAATTEAQLQLFMELMPDNHFMNVYAMSELAPATSTKVNDTKEHMLKTVGRILKGIDLKIQDPKTGEFCPTGVDGEIVMRGYALMAGYYKLPPEEQAYDEDGYMHSGDVGHMTEDGYLVLTGRIKNIIVRGGENIMPGEIENAISALGTTKDVKVFGVPDDFYGEVVGACMIMKEGVEFDKEETCATLLEKIASFKVPVYFDIVSDFPMLSNGKVDMVNLKEAFLKRIK